MREAQRQGRCRRMETLAECEQVECLNCGTSYRGRYCPICGQTSQVRRITTGKMLRSLASAVVGGDSTFFNTAVDLLYRPGYMVRDYLCGKRSRYFAPLRMLICLVAVFALASFVVDNAYEPFGIMQDSSLDIDSRSESLNRVMRFVLGLLSNNVVYALVSAFVYVIPFKLLLRRYSIQRPDGSVRSLNTAEHFYTMVYVSCQSMFLSFLLLPFSGMPGADAAALYISFAAGVLLPAWCYRQIFELRWVRSLVISLAASILTYIFLAGLVIFAFGLFYGYDAIAR